ncbi:MAG: hypothetical protein PHX13_05570 [Thiovulaceae bacterium]|nr:hypothetical protein [Sulfurimonadaceae bacterium]
MFTFLNKLFKKKEEVTTSFPLNIEKLLKKCKTLPDYIKLLELTVDTCYELFENQFVYQNKHKVSIVVAIIFAKFSQTEIFNKEEEQLHFNLIFIILNRLEIASDNMQFKEFQSAMIYIDDALAEVNINDHNANFFISNAYASYLYPYTDLYKLTREALLINDFFTPIQILAENQKKFFSKY